MKTLKQLQEQIADLQKQAEEVRAGEMDGAIVEIKKLMAEFDVTIDDLKETPKKGRKQATTTVQFRDKEGNTWSGRGRMPSWLKDQDKEQYRER